MSEQDVVADAHQLAAVGGGGGKLLWRSGATPLDEEAAEVNVVRSGEALHHRGYGCMMAFAEGNGDGELAVGGEVDLAGDSDVAVQRLTELRTQLHVLAEVLEPVAGANVAAGGAGEAAACSHCERGVSLPGEQAALAGNVDGAGGVAGSAAVEVRGEQSVALEPREE